MFVCVTALFICLANKCIINKPPAACFFFSFFPCRWIPLALASASLHSCANEAGRHRALAAARPSPAPRWGSNSVVQDSLTRVKPGGEVSHSGAQTFEGKKKRTPARTNAKSLTKSSVRHRHRWFLCIMQEASPHFRPQTAPLPRPAKLAPLLLEYSR